MIGISLSPYQKKSLKTQIRASTPETVAITEFWEYICQNGQAVMKKTSQYGIGNLINEKQPPDCKLKK